METVRIEFEPLIDRASRDFIADALDGYSMVASGCPDWCPVNFVLRGARGEVLGGLLGQLWGGWLHVTYLWIGKAARGQGHGTRLMQEAESYASAKGGIGAIANLAAQAAAGDLGHGFLLRKDFVLIT